ncbi:MAG TPA: hypothetical protein VGX21_08250 [Methylomirabilota bacterium]|jgi:hypothetical protein|nr:hypothetical protein [Methylomirabilota bacterium]
MLYTRVLNRLEAGPARTEELARICNRFGAIIHELRRAGVCIVTRRAPGVSYVYELIPARGR